MSTKLFVGNLSFGVTENDLQDAFAAHGTVTEANLMVDRVTGRPRGFGFVTMSSPEEAKKAIDALNGTSLCDRSITVNEARRHAYPVACQKPTPLELDPAINKGETRVRIPCLARNR
jgi:cold-inducible RNA-binding protein